MPNQPKHNFEIWKRIQASKQILLIFALLEVLGGREISDRQMEAFPGNIRKNPRGPKDL